MNTHLIEKTKWISARFCYFTIVLILTSLFLENFIFSENIGLLGFREIDDYAFQSTLRTIHSGSRFFSLNDYAYGWIYWAFMAIITYPFYLISHYLSIDWPLIVVPRQVSLLSGIASLFYLRKILCHSITYIYIISDVWIFFVKVWYCSLDYVFFFIDLLPCNKG